MATHVPCATRVGMGKIRRSIVPTFASLLLVLAPLGLLLFGIQGRGSTVFRRTGSASMAVVGAGVALVGALLIWFPYRPYPAVSADRESQVLWVFRALDNSFAAGGFELNSTKTIRGGFSLFVSSFARLFGVDTTWFVLTILVVLGGYFAIAILARALFPGDPLRQALLASLGLAGSLGSLGYNLAYLPNHVFDLIPRSIAYPLLLVAFALILSSSRSGPRVLGAVVLMFIGFFFQQPVSIALAFVWLAVWATTPCFQHGTNRHDGAKPNPVLAAAIIAVSALLFSFFLLQAFLGVGEIPLLLALFVPSFLMFLFLPVSLPRSEAFSRAAFLSFLPRVGVSVSVVFGMLVVAALSARDGQRSLGFFEGLETYDVILSEFRSPSVAFSDVDPQSVGFLLVFGVLNWLILRRSKGEGAATLQAGASHAISMFFALVVVSEVFSALPGLGGYSIWPLASSPILAILLFALTVARLDKRHLLPALLVTVIVFPGLRALDKSSLELLCQALAILVSVIHLRGLRGQGLRQS